MHFIQAFAFDFSLLQQVRLGWIDFLTVIALLLGLHLGNRTGASKQVLSFGLWLIVIIAAAVGHRFIGPLLAKWCGLAPWLGDLIAYLSIVTITAVTLAMITRQFADRVEATTAFGRLEYVIGPAAAMIRNFAVLLVIISAIHGLSVSSASEQRERKEQMNNYGMILYPTKGMIRAAVFDQSTTGAVAKKFLSFLMVDPDRPVQQASLR